jgi:hypothetical protein
MEQAYYLVNFARRMAVYAARIGDVAILKICTLGFVFDENLVEWRDLDGPIDCRGLRPSTWERYRYGI